MRLKTAPRVILGLAVVGALIYGANYYIDNRPKQAAVSIDTLAAQPATVVIQQTDVLPPVQSATQPPVALQPPPQPAPARTQQDSALDALLKGGTK